MRWRIAGERICRLLAFPFPYIANIAGWITTELGRQPWLIYGLYPTSEGASKIVSSGNVLFTLVGLTGLYFVLGLLYLFLVGHEVMRGPDGHGHAAHGEARAEGTS